MSIVLSWLGSSDYNLIKLVSLSSLFKLGWADACLPAGRQLANIIRIECFTMLRNYNHLVCVNNIAVARFIQ